MQLAHAWVFLHWCCTSRGQYASSQPSCPRLRMVCRCQHPMQLNSKHKVQLDPEAAAMPIACPKAYCPGWPTCSVSCGCCHIRSTQANSTASALTSLQISQRCHFLEGTKDLPCPDNLQLPPELLLHEDVEEMQQEIEAQQRHFVQLHQAMEVLREERQVGLPCLLQPPVWGQYVPGRPSPDVSPSASTQQEFLT